MHARTRRKSTSPCGPGSLGSRTAAVGVMDGAVAALAKLYSPYDASDLLLAMERPSSSMVVEDADLVLHIMQFCGLRSLLRSGTCCRCWHSCTRSDLLWRGLCTQRWTQTIHCKECPAPYSSWREVCRHAAAPIPAYV